MSAMFDHLSLEPGPAESEWHRAVVSAHLAAATGSVPLRLALRTAAGGPPEPSSHPASGAWRDAEHQMARAVIDLEEVRDEHGTLIELTGPVAPAIASAAFLNSALRRLGARQAFLLTTDGRTLRMRDAWRADSAADVAALLNAGSLVEETLWLADRTGIQAVVTHGVVYTANGVSRPVVQTEALSADRDQIIFARALLTFLGGLLAALVFAWATTRS